MPHCARVQSSAPCSDQLHVRRSVAGASRGLDENVGGDAQGRASCGHVDNLRRRPPVLPPLPIRATSLSCAGSDHFCRFPSSDYPSTVQLSSEATVHQEGEQAPMWPDNETDRDFVNFTGVADTIAEIIVQAGGRPISIGVSGAWGTGKSSLIKLTEASLKSRPRAKDSPEFIFVQFNAWLYQGYDDARAALMEVIATTLEREATERKAGIEQVASLLKQVNWLRAAKLTAGSAMALSLGLPPVGLLGEGWTILKSMLADGVDEGEIAAAEGVASKAKKEVGGLLKEKPKKSPPKEIDALRTSFEGALEKMNVTLVVLIDDLDRCLPGTTISTLEAIRHFLFLKRTAFVIAADDAMIKHAVKSHFGEVTEDLVTNYFDKLIQVPIRVPPLGTQEVRAYLMMLFLENSTVGYDDREDVRRAIAQRLTETWKGARVDRAFVAALKEFPPALLDRFDTADRLAPIMTSASGIAGNPRLVKRFLNALSIRMAISSAHGVGVDETVLAKLHLFERLGPAAAYNDLRMAVTTDEQGKAGFLAEWEEQAHRGDAISLAGAWDTGFVREWLTLPPRLADVDLRGALYVSREHSPLITPEDRLSSEGAELLTAMLSVPDMAGSLADRLPKLPSPELGVIMARLVARAKQEHEWGTPPILDACLAVARADPAQAQSLAAFLQTRPVAQIQPDIVPKIEAEPWAGSVVKEWEKKPDLDKVVRNAIAERRKNGHLAVQ